MSDRVEFLEGHGGFVFVLASSRDALLRALPEYADRIREKVPDDRAQRPTWLVPFEDQGAIVGQTPTVTRTEPEWWAQQFTTERTQPNA